MLDKTQSVAEKTLLLMEDILSCRNSIEDALSYAHGSYTFDDVVLMIMTGKCHFYKLDGCWIIMQLVMYPQYKVYHCFLAGGSQEALDKTWNDVRLTAKTLDCKYVTITGRHGWVRRLLSRGWLHMYSTMGKEV